MPSIMPLIELWFPAVCSNDVFFSACKDRHVVLIPWKVAQCPCLRAMKYRRRRCYLPIVSLLFVRCIVLCGTFTTVLTHAIQVICDQIHLKIIWQILLFLGLLIDSRFISMLNKDKACWSRHTFFICFALSQGSNSSRCYQWITPTFKGLPILHW